MVWCEWSSRNYTLTVSSSQGVLVTTSVDQGESFPWTRGISVGNHGVIAFSTQEFTVSTSQVNVDDWHCWYFLLFWLGNTDKMVCEFIFLRRLQVYNTGDGCHTTERSESCGPMSSPSKVHPIVVQWNGWSSPFISPRTPSESYSF